MDKINRFTEKNGKIRLFTALLNTKVKEINDMVWEIEFPNGLTSFNEKILEMPENKNYLLKEIVKISGKEIHLKYKKNNTSESKKSNNTQINDLGININIID